MRTLPVCCLLTAALGLGAGPARGQFQMTPPRQELGQRYRFRTDDQTAATQKLRDDARAKLREARTAARRGPPPPGGGRLDAKALRLREREPAAAYRALQERLAAVLTPEQQKRWRELTGEPVRFRVEIDPFSR